MSTTDRHRSRRHKSAAGAYVATNEAASDVVHDAWIGVITGLDRFEGRSSLKAWMYRIVINKAITKGRRDARSIPFSSLSPDQPSADPSRFHQSGRWSGWWLPEEAVTHVPDRIVVTKETRAMIGTVIATLPPNERIVITLRDVLGLGADEACELLDVSEANQRVLLHRARTRVRTALEGGLGGHAGAES